MIIVFPTETCYGLGCSVFDNESVERVKELKSRDSDKCLPVVVHGLDQWKEVAVLNNVARRLSDAFWPGPLTLVTRKRAQVPESVCKETIACRVSSHSVVEALTAEIGPIVATSANISGGPNPSTIDQVPLQIRDSADWVIDGGGLDGEPSTVYSCLTMEVLREGPISRDSIIEKIKNQ